MFTFLETLDDPRLAAFRELKKSNFTRHSETFIAEGDKLVERLLQSDYELVSILLGEQQAQRMNVSVPDHVPVYVIPDRQIEAVVGFNFHRGALACGRRKPLPTVAEWLSSHAPPDLALRCQMIVCSHIQNPENLGAILRIAAAFGMAAVVLGPGCADPLSRRVLRVSMGTVLRMPLLDSKNLLLTLGQLASPFEIPTYATVLDSQAVPLQLIKPSRRAALVFGDEGHGLPPEIVSACTHHVSIPMADGVDSLNVAIAAGIFAHHFSNIPPPTAD